MYVCVYVCVCICVYVCICVCKYVYICIYTYMCAYMCIYMYIHIYMLALCGNKLLAFSPVAGVNITFHLNALMAAAQKCCHFKLI